MGEFIEIDNGLFVDAEFVEAFKSLGLDSFDAVFAFDGGDDLAKANLAKHRSRIKFEVKSPDVTLYLKRYNNVPANKQIKNWLQHRSKSSTSDFDRLPGEDLTPAGITTPRTVAYGGQWGKIFEKRSFMVMTEVAGQSLEKKLPECFTQANSAENHRLRCEFIDRLADFSSKFHATGFRHRDFYLAHIFENDDKFSLIDMHRAFRPGLLSRRFLLKDLTQLYYSAPGQYFSRADRLRFYKRYAGKTKLNSADRWFIGRIKAKAWRMADHDIKHGRPVPFAN